MKPKFYIKIILFSLLFLITSFLVWKIFSKEKRQLNLEKPFQVDLIIDGFRYQTSTQAENVEGFLQEKKIEIVDEDLVYPEPDALVRPNDNIYLNQSRTLSVEVDGETKEFKTTRRTIEKLLQDEGIKLNPFDIIKPGLEEMASDKKEIVITRIEKKNILEEEEIEFETVTKGDDDLEWKKEKIKQEGENGLKEVKYELVYKNGELVSKTKLSSKVTKEAVPKIIVEGRKIEIVSTQRGLASWYAFKGGMYCASVRYPRGTWLRVTSKDNGKQIIVQVNDYGPDPGTGKVIDLDKVAFAKLMSVGAGVIDVKIEEIKSGK